MYFKNIYVDIEILETDYKNFLDYGDVLDFKMIETAGASLPYIYMKIIVRDDVIKNALQLTNKIKITVGNSPDTAESFTIDLFNVLPDKDGFGVGYQIELAGFIGSQEYMVSQRTKSYWGNSLFVVDKVMKEFFGKEAKEDTNANAIDSTDTTMSSIREYLGNQNLTNADLNVLSQNEFTNSSALGGALDNYLNKNEPKKHYVTTDFKRTNENQVVWRQHNITACYFVADTLLHTDVQPLFPLFTFDRYLNFYIRDLNNLILQGPVVTFTSLPATKENQIQYFSNFNVDSFKPMYNLYSGFNKVTEIYGVQAGLPSNVISKNEPILASTAETEVSDDIGNNYSLNNIQSGNVHKTYNTSFVHNTNKLVSLSSMLGVLQLIGPYYKGFKPTDLVDVRAGISDNDPTISGLYLIDTIVTTVDFASGGFITYVYVTRDNKNNVENYIPKSKKKKWIKIKSKFMNELLTAVSQVKYAYAQGMRIIDGRFMQELLSFAIETKNNALRSFRIAGVTLDFNSSANILTSFIALGNSLLNLLFDMLFPIQIATTLRDLILRNPLKAVGVISTYVDLYVPYEIKDIVMVVVESLFNVTDTLNSIAEDNGISVSAQEGISVMQPSESETTQETSEINYVAEGQQRVNNIINSFENNTTGLDIPFPVIELTEAQSLMTDSELENLVADKTIDKLTELGYMNNVNSDDFKEILLGNEPIDFNIINAINESAGNTFAYRYWGTYNSLIELTSFYIKKSFKDKFRTIPCTKLINATQNTKIFFACPSTEKDLKFYINSKRIELDSFEVDLGYGDIYGNPILYTVYYTEDGYNSNSVMFEVKQGGMV